MKAANLARFYPAWTVTREQWVDMMMPSISGVAIDTLLFSRIGSPLCHRNRIISRTGSYAAFRGTYVRRLRAFLDKSDSAVVRQLHHQLAQELAAQIAPPTDSPASVLPRSAVGHRTTSSTERSFRFVRGPESVCRLQAEMSSVQALMDLALPRLAGLGDGPRQVHPPWSITSASPASPAPALLETTGEEDSRCSVVEQPGVHVVELSRPQLQESPELLPLSGQSSSPTLPWGAADDSSPHFSPNRVQAGHSQDVPDEGSLFNVSLLSPGLFFRLSRGGQSPPAEGVLLPTTLDDFDDSILGDPYAWCEQFPGSESPLSLPVYVWPSGSAFLLDPTDCVGFGELRSAGGGDLERCSHYDLGDGRLLETGLPAVYRWESSAWITASSSSVSAVRRSSGVSPAPRLFTDVLGGSAGQGTSDGSGHQPTAGCGRHVVKSSDTVTVRYGIEQNVVLDDGLGPRTVVVSESRGR